MPVEVISLAEKHAQFKDAWSPRRVGRLDDYEIKLAKAEGAFDWHAHAEEDEFFLVTRGVLKIEIEGEDAVVLGPGEFCVIPRGVRHRPVAQTEKVHMMLIERAGVMNTGDNPPSDLTNPVQDL
ncbi:cupin domain-containing protein [Maricaulis sp.]|uniref:cupin domain-containing protein n=1 Tax=Maricaulis sp. TaxID=1486257 RepID=UPI00261FA73B|nr:cupin domain-containing protein [Maricaulis sp.]